MHKSSSIPILLPPSRKSANFLFGPQIHPLQFLGGYYCTKNILNIKVDFQKETDRSFLHGGSIICVSIIQPQAPTTLHNEMHNTARQTLDTKMYLNQFLHLIYILLLPYKNWHDFLLYIILFFVTSHSHAFHTHYVFTKLL